MHTNFLITVALIIALVSKVYEEQMREKDEHDHH